MSANTVVLDDGVNIGQNGAENDDEFLFRCFVDHPAYEQITNIDNPTTFLLGSTGAGLCCTKPLMSEVPLSPDGFIPRPL